MKGRRVKICLIASGDLWAGAEAVVYQLLKGLHLFKDLDITAVFLNQGRLADAARKLGVNVYVLDESCHSFLSLALEFRKIVRNCTPDIIHSHRYKENLLAYIGSRGVSDVNLIATQHGMPEVMSESTLKLRFRTFVNFQILAHRFARTVAVSEEMRKSLIAEYGFRSESVAVIHNGISISSSIPDIKDGRIVIGSAGRLCPVKDFGLMGDIAALGSGERDDVYFVLAGEGPGREALEEKIIQHGLQGRVKLLGHQDDMAACYKGLNLYMNTSVHEGFPMSVLEAMSFGLPVIAARVGGFPEIIEDGEQGYLVADRSPASLAEKCLLLCRDNRLREVLALKARQRVVDFFSSESMTLKYFQLYKEVLTC